MSERQCLFCGRHRSIAHVVPASEATWACRDVAGCLRALHGHTRSSDELKLWLRLWLALFLVMTLLTVVVALS